MPVTKASLLREITDNDERIFYARAFDRADLALKTYEPRFIDFTDPIKCSKLLNMTAQLYSKELTVLCYGGFEHAERRMTGFFPPYSDVDLNLFPLSCVEISYEAKFSRELTHRDFLGSVLGLGINREKVGDIVINGSSACIFAEKEVADFICSSLARVGRTAVKVRLLNSFTPKDSVGEERRLTVASLRLDAVLSAALHLSRGKVADLIKGEKAFINWIPVTNGAKNVNVGDVLTLRGSGRVIVKSLEGITKKDRYALILEIFD